MVGLGCPRGYGGCTLGLHSWRDRDFQVLFNLRMRPMQRRDPKARLPPATRNAGSGAEEESCTGRLVANGETW